jgi:hypothetical protein
MGRSILNALGCRYGCDGAVAGLSSRRDRNARRSDDPGQRGRVGMGHERACKRTPAMAAGITGHPWTVDDLYERVMRDAE